MDVNGTRFQLLLGANDWGNCTEDGINPLSQAWQNSDPYGGANSAWDEERSELIFRPCLLQIVGLQSHIPPRLSDRRGADRDRYGNWYWIDESGGTLKVNSDSSIQYQLP